MMGGYGWGWPGFLWMGLGGLFWLVVLGLLVWTAVRLLSSRTTTNQPPVHGPSPLEILEQRYARGEIDAVTFEQMRERLLAGQPGLAPAHDPQAPPPTRS